MIVGELPLRPRRGPVHRALVMLAGAAGSWLVFFCLTYLVLGFTISSLGLATLPLAGIAMGGAFMAGGYLFVTDPRPDFRAMLLLYLCGALIAWWIVLLVPMIWLYPRAWSAFVGAHLGAGIALFLAMGASGEEERRSHALVAVCLPVLLVCAAWVAEYYRFDPLYEVDATVQRDGEERSLRLNRIEIEDAESFWYLSSYDVAVPVDLHDVPSVSLRWPPSDSDASYRTGHRVEDPAERSKVRDAIEEARGFRDLPFLPRRPIDLEGEVIFRVDGSQGWERAPSPSRPIRAP